jgi:hypothetical protein
MRIAAFNSECSHFLEELYASTLLRETPSYSAQIDAHNDSLTGVANLCSSGFRDLLGHDKNDIHFDNHRIQAIWARERGMSGPRGSATHFRRRKRTTTIAGSSRLLNEIAIEKINDFRRGVLLVVDASLPREFTRPAPVNHPIPGG